MEVQVAMASSDGVYVNEHFGRARTFMIYRFTAGEWEHIENRENRPSCAGHEHSDDLLEQTAGLISDCWGVVIAQIGPTAFDLLISRRVLPFVLGGTVVEALETLRGNKQFERAVQRVER
ncbi:MAG: NifB/NifX family molybdenum-iron cluster-binding protein [Geobacteraceae bacterium]|jgi:nitrogen fixation protein NifX